jgi:hypothetical protein
MRDGTAGPGTPPELLSFGDWAAIATASRDAIEASPLVAAASLKDETDEVKAEVKKLRDEIKWVWPKVREHVTHCGVLIGPSGIEIRPYQEARPFEAVLCGLGQHGVLRGWAAYFRYGASKKTFSYLGWYAWWRLILWIRRKHPHLTWKRSGAATTAPTVSERTILSSTTRRRCGSSATASAAAKSRPPTTSTRSTRTEHAFV